MGLRFSQRSWFINLRFSCYPSLYSATAIYIKINAGEEGFFEISLYTNRLSSILNFLYYVYAILFVLNLFMSMAFKKVFYYNITSLIQLINLNLKIFQKQMENSFKSVDLFLQREVQSRFRILLRTIRVLFVQL